MERGYGWLQVKRASPMPPLAYLVAKTVMSIIFSAIIVIIVVHSGNVVRWRASVSYRVSQTHGHHDCRLDSFLRTWLGDWLLFHTECGAWHSKYPFFANVILFRALAPLAIAAQIPPAFCAVFASILPGQTGLEAGWLWQSGQRNATNSGPGGVYRALSFACTARL